jgi:hypothetical protein
LKKINQCHKFFVKLTLINRDIWSIWIKKKIFHLYLCQTLLSHFYSNTKQSFFSTVLFLQQCRRIIVKFIYFFCFCINELTNGLILFVIFSEAECVIDNGFCTCFCHVFVFVHGSGITCSICLYFCSYQVPFVLVLPYQYIYISAKNGSNICKIGIKH